MRTVTLLILIGCLAVYNLLGAVVFHFLEQPNETSSKSTESARFSTFLTNYACVDQAALETFVVAVISAYDAGVISAGNTTSSSSWDMSSSIFFAVTVLTTIGYGNISPSTTGGKIFCAFFGLFGIPAMGVALVGIGQKMTNIYKKLESSKAWCSKKTADRIIKFALFHTTCYCVFAVLPSVLFMLVEGWTFGTSMYYCFVTLTTVGFGDYVAGTTERDFRALYRLFVAFWILLGLAWVVTAISSAQDILGDVVDKLDSKVAEKEAKKAKGDADATSQKVEGSRPSIAEESLSA